MSRAANRVKAPTFAAFKKNPVGKLCDGAGLYFIEGGPQGQAAYRYKKPGQARDTWVGLGGLGGRDLKSVRADAERLRSARRGGKDPLQFWRELKRPAVAANARTFMAVASEYQTTNAGVWGKAHSDAWLSSLRRRCGPINGRLVGEVDADGVLLCIAPLWTTHNPAALKLLERIHVVICKAIVEGDHPGPSPAVLKNYLEHRLPRVKHAVEHRRAVNFRDISKVWSQLDGMVTGDRVPLEVDALRLVILTACRVSEIAGLRWDEIDLGGRVMTISPARMKMKRPHRVPLSDQAVAILERLATHRLGAHVFPGSRGNASHMPRQAVNRLMDRMGIDATPHGFRSSFKSWAAASNDFDPVAVEFCLNHVASGLEQAYQRDDLLLKRAPIMQQWADHCCRATNIHDISEARHRAG